MLIIILITLWVSYIRGAIALIAGVIGKLLIFLGAWYFAAPFANWAGPSLGALPWLAEKLEGSLPVANLLSEAEMGRITAQKLPELLDKLSLPPIIKFKLMEAVPELAASGSASVVAVAQEMAHQVALMILTALAFIALLFVGGILLRLVVRIFDLLLGGTFIGLFNRLLGMVLGFFTVSALLILIIGLTAPWLLTSPTEGKEALVFVLKNSYFYPRLLELYGVLVGSLIAGI
ncbi:MAG: CvpA family protein [Bacillota bacterium]